MSQDRTTTEAALSVIEAIHLVRDQLEPINDSMRAIFGDFHPHQPIMPDALMNAVERLLNSVLGNGNVATYYLWECNRQPDVRAVHEADGKVWPLRTIAELRAYLNREVENLDAAE